MDVGPSVARAFGSSCVARVDLLTAPYRAPAPGHYDVPNSFSIGGALLAKERRRRRSAGGVFRPKSPHRRQDRLGSVRGEGVPGPGSYECDDRASSKCHAPPRPLPWAAATTSPRTKGGSPTSSPAGSRPTTPGPRLQVAMSGTPLAYDEEEDGGGSGPGTPRADSRRGGPMVLNRSCAAPARLCRSRGAATARSSDGDDGSGAGANSIFGSAVATFGTTGTTPELWVGQPEAAETANVGRRLRAAFALLARPPMPMAAFAEGPPRSVPIGGEADLPGPGTYDLMDFDTMAALAAVNSDAAPDAKAPFGSSASRFVHSSEEGRIDVGPGSYNAIPGTTARATPRSAVPAFGGAERFAEPATAKFDEATAWRGPGKYSHRPLTMAAAVAAASAGVACRPATVGFGAACERFPTPSGGRRRRRGGGTPTTGHRPASRQARAATPAAEVWARQQLKALAEAALQAPEESDSGLGPGTYDVLMADAQATNRRRARRIAPFNEGFLSTTPRLTQLR